MFLRKFPVKLEAADSRCTVSVWAIYIICEWVNPQKLPVNVSVISDTGSANIFRE
jgi:hypothetical protein